MEMVDQEKAEKKEKKVKVVKEEVVKGDLLHGEQEPEPEAPNGEDCRLVHHGHEAEGGMGGLVPGEDDGRLRDEPDRDLDEAVGRREAGRLAAVHLVEEGPCGRPVCRHGPGASVGQRLCSSPDRDLNARGRVLSMHDCRSRRR
jgi:hypothetical protein